MTLSINAEWKEVPFERVDQPFVIITLGQPAARHVIVQLIYGRLGSAKLANWTLLRNSVTLSIGVYKRRAWTRTQITTIMHICTNDMPRWRATGGDAEPG